MIKVNNLELRNLISLVFRYFFVSLRPKFNYTIVNGIFRIIQ